MFSFYKIFRYAFTNDPWSSQSDKRQLTGQGYGDANSIPSLRDADNTTTGSSLIRLRETHEYIDTTTTTSRQNRYKEYFRLLSVAEIDMALTVFADEACVGEHTKVMTLFHGPVPIKKLSETKTTDRFPVYCYDLEKEDFTVGWAHSPRKTKKAITVKIVLDDGTILIATPDHRLLDHNRKWIQAGELKEGDRLLPFYRVKPQKNYGNPLTNQFPRTYSYERGWIHERQFVDDWRYGNTQEHYKVLNHTCKLTCEGISWPEANKQIKTNFPDVKNNCHKILEEGGFTNIELRRLEKLPRYRRVIACYPWREVDVYDLTVEKHNNFCTKSVVAHNCQRNEEGRVFKVECSNSEVKKELEYLFFHRDMLNLDQVRLWDVAKRLFTYGDFFWEVIINPDNPKEGVYKLADLPPESMYRIETTKGKLVEFQQSKEGPDYQALIRSPVTHATEADLNTSTAFRFPPEEIVHMRLGDSRRTFTPYGVSVIEAARGPAHQMKILEDSMVVYRLCLIGDTRVRTDTGYKYIKDIRPGDTVISYSPEDSKQKFATVTHAYNQGIKDLYRVRSKHIEIIGTAEHPILVNRKGVVQYVKIKDLIPGKDKDRLIIPKDERPIVNHQIPKIVGEPYARLTKNQKDEIRNKKYSKAALLRQCRDHNKARNFLYGKSPLLLEQALEFCKLFDINEDNLEITGKVELSKFDLPDYVTTEFARLFGFLCGDGSISNGYQLCFAAGTNKEINKFYSELLSKFFGKVNFEQDKRMADGQGKYSVYSVKACKIITKMGYINDHDIIRIPQWVFNSPIEIRKAFVEGLSDADGCERYTKAGTWFSSIELSNHGLLEDVKEVWSSIGFCSGHISVRYRDDNREILGKKNETNYLLLFDNK